VAIAILAIVPVMIALMRLDLVNFVILLAFKLLAATFFAPVVLGLNWRRGTKAGAISAMIGGPAAVLIWQHFGNPYFLFLEAAEAGVLVSTGLFILVSLVTPRSPESATGPFFASGGVPSSIV
jgi:Na+/pantothenate symporter